MCLSIAMIFVAVCEARDSLDIEAAKDDFPKPCIVCDTAAKATGCEVHQIWHETCK